MEELHQEGSACSLQSRLAFKELDKVTCLVKDPLHANLTSLVGDGLEVEHTKYEI